MWHTPQEGQDPPFQDAQPQCALCWAQVGPEGSLNTSRCRAGSFLLLLFAFCFWMAGNCLLLVKGGLQTSPTSVLPAHDCGLHKVRLSQHFLHGSLLIFPKGMLVLSQYHSRPWATGTVSRGVTTGAGPIHSTARLARGRSGNLSIHW